MRTPKEQQSARTILFDGLQFFFHVILFILQPEICLTLQSSRRTEIFLNIGSLLKCSVELGQKGILVQRDSFHPIYTGIYCIPLDNKNESKNTKPNCYQTA